MSQNPAKSHGQRRPMDRLAGVILCGGESRRMGAAKAWLDFHGQTLLSRMVEVVGQIAGPVIVVAAPGQVLPPLPPHVLRADDAQVNCGPLAGMLAGLKTLPPSCDWAFVCGCDTPLLRSEVIELLALQANAHSEAEAIVPRDDERDYPLAALYRPTVIGRIEQQLASGNLRLMQLLSKVALQSVPVDCLRSVDADLRSLLNCNTPEEYERALSMG